MAQVFPTKSNLMSTKKSLDLAKLGYDLLDRKRNILVHEMMQLIDKASYRPMHLNVVLSGRDKVHFRKTRQNREGKSSTVSIIP